MLWAALLLPLGPDATPPPHDTLHGIASWALQFSPRVAVSDEAVLIEVEASVQLVLERIAARLGPEHVLRPVLTDDHRLEWMQMWQPAALAAAQEVLCAGRHAAAVMGAAGAPETVDARATADVPRGAADDDRPAPR